MKPLLIFLGLVCIAIGGYLLLVGIRSRSDSPFASVHAVLFESQGVIPSEAYRDLESEIVSAQEWEMHWYRRSRFRANVACFALVLSGFVQVVVGWRLLGDCRSGLNLNTQR